MIKKYFSRILIDFSGPGFYRSRQSWKSGLDYSV